MGRIRRAFTLIEIIFVVVISAILALGAFRATEALYLRSARAKALTELSLQSQIVLDQVASLLYYAIPNSVIGYMKSSSDASCEALADASTSYRALEWLALDEEHLIDGGYDGLVDLSPSKKVGGRVTLVTPGTDRSKLQSANYYNLIFAGAFDRGDEAIRACTGAFGWHGNESALGFDLQIDNDNNITITDSQQPDRIYEKFYLSDGAYAVVRSEDVDRTASCMQSLHLESNEKDALLLFYGYRPWKQETFCADLHRSTTVTGEGNVTLLAQDVKGFIASVQGGVIRLKIDMQRAIRGGNGGSAVVHITKQKVVF